MRNDSARRASSSTSGTSSDTSSGNTTSTQSVWSETCGRVTAVPDVGSAPSGHYDFISFLGAAQKAGIIFLPINWQPNLEKLGRGGDGEVRQHQVTSTTAFAFKRMLINQSVNYEDAERRVFRALQSEVFILGNRSIRAHPNIVNLEAVCWDISNGKLMPVLVYEKAPYGDLRSFLNGPVGRSLDFESRLDMCYRIGSAIQLMHSLNIIHGDVKPGNILVFENSTGDPLPKMTDFGYASLTISHDDKIIMGCTPGWVAPEWYSRNGAIFTHAEAKKMDIYSFGLVCWFVIFGEQFPAESIHISVPESLLSTISKVINKLRLSSDQQQQVTQFFISALAKDPNDRPNLDVLFQQMNDTLSWSPFEHVSPIKRMLDNSLELQVSKLAFTIDFTHGQESTDELLHQATSEFSVSSDLDVFCQADYRLRQYIWSCLDRRVRGLRCEKCHRKLALQIAFCYHIGFGTIQDHEKGEQWLTEHKRGFNPGDSGLSSFEQEVKHSRYRRGGFESDVFSHLAKGGYLDAMDYVHEYRKGGVLKIAQQHIEREKESMERVLEGFHPAVISLSRILATIFVATGRFGSATELIDTRIEDLERVPPSYREPRSEVSYLSVGQIMVHHTKGETSKTEAMIFEHFLRLELTDQLAALRREQGLVREAEALYRDVIETQINMFGGDHPMVTRSRVGLALALVDQGSLSQAQLYYRDSLKSTKQILGNNHSEPLRISNNLAVTLAKLGKYDIAEALFKSIYNKMLENKSLGENHEHTLVVFCNWASLLCYQSKYRESEEHIRRVVDTMTKTLERSHPATQTGVHNLAIVLAAQGRYRDAKVFFEESTAIWKDVLGPEHPIFLEGQANLSRLREMSDGGRNTEVLADQFTRLNTTAVDPNKTKSSTTLQPVLRQLDERGTTKRGICLLDSKWMSELTERYDKLKKKKDDEKYKKIQEALRRATHVVSQYKTINDEISAERIDAVNCNTSIYKVQSLFISENTSTTETSASSRPNLNSKMKDFVISREDDRMMLFVGFRKPVKIRSIYLTSLGGHSKNSFILKPMLLKLHKNHGTILDSDLTAEIDWQEFSLKEADWDATAQTMLVQTGRHFVKLQGVSDLNILVAGETGRRTRLDRIVFYGDV